MKKILTLACVSLVCLPVAGCTLTPPREGYDILETGYKAENQDPVAVPVKEPSDRPWIKTSTNKPAPAPLFVAPAEKPPVKKEVPAPVVEKKEPPKPAPVPVPEVKKEEPVKPAVKPEPKAEPKVEPKAEEKKVEEPVKEKAVAASAPATVPCDDKTAVMPPPPPGDGKGPAPVAVKREKLQGGDRLKITVFREKDLTGEYQVSDKGTISFPMIGETKAAGLTPAELQKDLVTKLSAGYLVKPDINVEWLNGCNAK